MYWSFKFHFKLKLVGFVSVFALEKFLDYKRLLLNMIIRVTMNTSFSIVNKYCNMYMGIFAIMRIRKTFAIYALIAYMRNYSQIFS